MIRLRHVFYALLVIGAMALVWLVVIYKPEERHALGGYILGVDEARNRHDTDYPRVVSEEDFDPRFIVLSAADRIRIPIADRFDSPIGTEEGGFTYDAQPFHQQNDERGGMHEGQDLNGIGGENTDDGDPVYASGRGMVVYAGTPSPDWGNVVILAHRLPGGEIIQTLYGHLGKINAFRGQIVPRGQKIGSMGTTNGLYWAHLHYEAMVSSFNEAGAPGYVKEPTNRFDPSELNNKIKKENLSSVKNDIFLTLERLEIEKNRSRIQFRPVIVPETPRKNITQHEDRSVIQNETTSNTN